MKNSDQKIGTDVSFHNDRVLRLKQVTEKVGLKKSWIYKQVSLGNFPEPVKLGPRASGFLESEIDAWLEERIQASRGQQ